MDNLNGKFRKKNDWESGSEFLPDKSNDETSQDDNFINSFISDFNMGKLAKNDQLAIDNTSENKDFLAISLNVFGKVEVSENTQNKIIALQKITNEIEKKSNIDYDSFYTSYAQKYIIDYKKSLNPSQLYAVANNDTPMLVIAGAGSGKTRTIVYKVAYLLENNIPPSNILLLTFTRKSAKEMIDRTTQLLGSNVAERVMAGTFHAFSNFVLRKYANLLNINPKFTIIDTVDSEDIISLIRDELIKSRDRYFPKKSRLLEVISTARNWDISIKETIELQFSGLEDYVADIELIAKTFDRYKDANSIFDYDDLMIFLRNQLADNQVFKEKIQRDYLYVLVDEYQDTNIHQKQIVDFIAEKHRRIMVVGDDSQSIYSFRGANYENILTFPVNFPEGKVVKIEKNYRSNQSILNFTNSIINNAKLGYRKQLYSDNKTTWLPKIQKFYDQETEAAFVVDRIQELLEKGIKPDEIAVIYRATYHGNFIQNELTRRAIPYVVVGGIKFIERRHVRDVIAILRIIQNPYDATAWHRVLKLIYGIGNVNAKQIIVTIKENRGLISFEKFKKRSFYPDLQKLEELLINASVPKISVQGKIDLIRQFYAPLLKALEDDYETRMLDIDVLEKLSLKYDELDKFLADFALDPPSNKFQSKTDPLIDETEERPITLTTVHSAKGLEWYAVFIPHVLDGLFPSVKSMKTLENLEEERRLFYVACTRAKEQLYITMPSFFSSWDEIFTRPSRFLVEIDNSKYEH